MKMFAISALFAGGIVLGIGIALAAVGAIIAKHCPIHIYYDHGFHIDCGSRIASEEEVREMAKTAVDDFRNVVIDVPAADIRFVEGDGFAVEYRIRAKDVACESRDGTLAISARNSNLQNRSAFKHGDCFVHVHYPKGAEFGSIDLESSAGDLRIEDGFVCDRLAIDFSAGDAKLRNVKGKLDVDMSAGNFAAENCEFERAEFNLSAGDVKLANCTMAGGKVDMSAGDFEAKALVLTKSLAIDSAAGSVDIQFVPGQQIGYDLDLTVGSATVNGEKHGKRFAMKDGYDIVLKTNMTAGSIVVVDR